MCVAIPECGTAARAICEGGHWVIVPGEACEDTTQGAITQGAVTTTTMTGVTSGGEVVPCGETLPEEGSSCATPNERCAPDANACEPYTYALCIDGAWKYYEAPPDHPSSCPCSPLPMDGQPCAYEGLGCISGCPDPCMPCDFVRCENGLWHKMTTSPSCLDCDALCQALVEPMCDYGPADVPTCLDDCESASSMCPYEMSNVRLCAGMSQIVVCDQYQRPTIPVCSSSFDDLYQCLGIEGDGGSTT